MLRSSVAEPSMVPGPISSSSCARSCSRVSQVGLTQVTDSSFSCRSRWRDRVVLPTPAGPLRNSDCTLLLNRSSSFSNAYRIECDANTGRAASGANGLASSLYCSRNKRTESAGNILIGSYPQDTRSYLMALGAKRNWSGRQDDRLQQSAKSGFQAHLVDGLRVLKRPRKARLLHQDNHLLRVGDQHAELSLVTV